MSRARSLRARRPASLVAACVCISLFAAAAPAVSPAAEGLGNSFNELTSKAAESETRTATTSTTPNGNARESNTDTSRTLILVALGAAVLLLAAIGFVIVRDARRVAPAGDADLADARAARDTSVQMRKRRAKAKAARQQRKRNR